MQPEPVHSQSKPNYDRSPANQELMRVREKIQSLPRYDHWENYSP
ncbi:MAG: hypothetical protein Q4B28_01810 [bacterium]|nr:hypothetical protein [bacterium]